MSVKKIKLQWLYTSIIISDNFSMDMLHRKNLLVYTALLVITMTACVPPASLRSGLFNIQGSSRKNIVNTAKRYMGVKYKSGGINPSGFDCSGYVYYVYKKNGYIIPRNSEKQCKMGIRIPLNSAKPGDLLFFNTSGNSISHVAIYMGRDKFIHAPSTGKKVSFSSLNNPYWKKRYICVVTYFRNKNPDRDHERRKSFIPVSYN